MVADRAGHVHRDALFLAAGSAVPISPEQAELSKRDFTRRVESTWRPGDVWCLERAGDLMEFNRKELGLGVVNPRTERVETVEEIRQSITRALERYPQDQLFINPDCGFATFSNRPVNSDEIALNKVCAMREAVEPFR